VHIVIALRLVPDFSGDIELTSDGADLDREWLDLRLNEFDDHALEEALLLKELSGAKVTAVAINTDGIDKTLQIALARGADAAFKIAADGDGELSSRASAPLFAAAARELGADVFLTGVQTPEDLFGHLAPLVAAHLGWPGLSAVGKVRFEGGEALVQQEYSGGAAATFRVAPPVAIGVQTASRPIRYVAGSQLRQFAATKIETKRVSANIGLALAERQALRWPDRISSATMLEGDAEAIASQLQTLLIERGLIKEIPV
jgi:electron transfer flavoprotein beta subunit